MSVFSIKVHGKVSLSIRCYKHTDKTMTADQSIQYYRQEEGLLSLNGNSGWGGSKGNRCQHQVHPHCTLSKFPWSDHQMPL